MILSKVILTNCKQKLKRKYALNTVNIEFLFNIDINLFEIL